MRCWISSHEDVKVGDSLCDVRLHNKEVDLSKLKYVYFSADENEIITEIHKIMSEEDVQNQFIEFKKDCEKLRQMMESE